MSSNLGTAIWDTDMLQPMRFTAFSNHASMISGSLNKEHQSRPGRMGTSSVLRSPSRSMWCKWSPEDDLWVRPWKGENVWWVEEKRISDILAPRLLWDADGKIIINRCRVFDSSRTVRSAGLWGNSKAKPGEPEAVGQAWPEGLI